MPRDSQGNCSQNFDWNQDAANGIGIEPDRHQTNDEDHLQMLTDSLDREGRGGMKSALAMGNNRITGLANGTALTDGLALGQAQASTYNYAALDVGTGNAYAVGLSPNPASYSEGLTVSFVPGATNTGASTLQVGGLVPAPPIEWQRQALTGGEIQLGGLCIVRYSNNAFQLISHPLVLPRDKGGTGGTLGTAADADTGTDPTNVPTNADLPETTVQVFTSSGTFNKSSLPANTKSVTVETLGGGGGGGGCALTGSGEASAGGGGGAGGYSRETIPVSSLGTTETVTVGPGGAGAIGQATGSTGGTSSFGAFLQATGGTGGGGGGAQAGSSVSASNAGQGGIGSGGDINSRGGAGDGGNPWPLVGVASTGRGGDSYFGGGSGNTAVAGTSNGVAGDTGSGGSGGANGPNQVAAANGADGGDGIVIVTANGV